MRQTIADQFDSLWSHLDQARPDGTRATESQPDYDLTGSGGTDAEPAELCTFVLANLFVFAFEATMTTMSYYAYQAEGR